MKLRIAHLYPGLLNLYGDRGNILVLTQRAKWRDLDVEVDELSLGDVLPAGAYDLLFLGGGPDQEQSIVGQDLQQKAAALLESVEDGAVLLSICGGYQLLGQYYRTRAGEEIPGIGLFSVYTEAGTRRLEGNIAVSVPFLQAACPVIGFENHSGQTFFLSDTASRGEETTLPLGHVLFGFGNNASEGLEGARYKNAFGTYLHGPLLAKNPHLADYLLTLALARRYGPVRLAPLTDTLEYQANSAVYQRYRPGWWARLLRQRRGPRPTLLDRRH
ncbi:type 1 glutamine amidotransferase [Gelria sp. Kuro-4]|uniref:type 1 glutamine amidotransferase n=1 Tax=Gelria sp. Kuro-4 TaxID=2796927 RepID=UPI001BEDA472|nr:glutamine amidotransferase [Gelria sp. Kuro-4]BCV24246.1 glutamine amidotransferase [Gelria sp. Kuro-4]